METFLRAARSIVGAVVGAVVGVALYEWLLNQGYFALVMPGALLGFGCHIASATRSNVRGVVTAFGAVLVSMLAFWRNLVVPAGNFREFWGQFSHASSVSYLMIVVAVLLAYWWGRDAGGWFLPKQVRREETILKD